MARGWSSAASLGVRERVGERSFGERVAAARRSGEGCPERESRISWSILAGVTAFCHEGGGEVGMLVRFQS